LGFLLATGPMLSMAETVSAQLARLGARPEDVRNIVVTHLDLDHAGGLSDFPEATVHVVAREHALALSHLPLRHRSRYRPVQFSHGPRWRDYEPGGERWFGFEGVRAVEGVGADLLLVPLVGHTLGHTGVAVRSGDRWMLHAGDAYFHHNEVIGTAAPRTLEYFQRAVAMDGQQRLANRDRLAELARQGTVDVFCAHDPDELDAMRTHAP
jgi:glyoxylase-like metal-dependent hydrolase (beta-lactamase superfamily II)